MSLLAPGADQNLFKQLFELSPDPAWIIDGNRFVECNQAAIATLGYATRDEMLNLHPSRLSPPTQPDGQDSYRKAEQMMAQAKEKGLHRFEWTHTRANGENFVAEVTLSLASLGSRQVIYCIWRDISKRREIEEQLLQQNSTLSTIVENFPGGISLFDASLQLVAHNRKFRELLELPDALFDKKNISFEDFIRFNTERGDYGAGDPATIIHDIVERARNFQQHKFERVRPNGVALEIRGVPLPHGGFVTTYMDITDRKRSEQQLRIAATAFESQEGMFITDAQKTILRVNRAFSEVTGYSSEEAIGQTPRLLKSGRHDAEFYRVMEQSLEQSGQWQGEIWNRRKSGETFPEWLMITAVKDENHEVTNYVAALTDITARKLAEEEIRTLAFYDTLTQLPNRRLLNDRLSLAMAASKRSGRFGAVIFLDLDNFKPLNDTHGHEVGDLLLQEAARRLKGAVREIDTVARFGGDEFVVMLGDLSADRAAASVLAERIAEKIRHALCEPYLLAVHSDASAHGTIEHHCTASIGLALFVGLDASQIDILKWADMAMYQAKEAGRNRVRVFQPPP